MSVKKLIDANRRLFKIKHQHIHLVTIRISKFIVNKNLGFFEGNCVTIFIFIQLHAILTNLSLY